MPRLAVRPLPLVLRELEVAAVHDVTPRLRRITLTGPQLSAFTPDSTGTGAAATPGEDFAELPAFSSPGFDDHVKCIFTADGGGSDLPVQLPHGIEWPPSSMRVARDYTPTRFDPESGELDLEFVLHGHGPAASWAREAQPGHSLHLVGPKMTTALPADLDWILLAGDETALPAMTRFARERPSAARAIIVVIIEDDNAKAPIDLTSDDEIHWIIGDPTDGDALTAAVASVLPDTGTGYAWAAGESRSLLPLRRLLKSSPCLGRANINVTGYWVHTETEQAGGPGTAAEVPSAAPAAGRPELPAAPIAWLAVRAALELGLPAALADRPLTAAELAERTATRPQALGLLLDALVEAQILTFDAPTYALAPLGDELVDDEHAAEHFLGHHADTALALLALGDALRSGNTDGDSATPWERHFGASVYRASQDDPEVFEELVESSEGLSFFLGALTAEQAVKDADHLVLTGPGAVTIGDALAAERGRRPVIAEEAAFLRVLRECSAAQGSLDFADLAELPRPAERGTTIVSALALGFRTDAEARKYLDQVHSRADHLVILERFTQDALNPRAHEAALTDFAMSGRAAVSAEHLASLAGPAWHLEREFELGWGMRGLVLSAAQRPRQPRP